MPHYTVHGDSCPSDGNIGSVPQLSWEKLGPEGGECWARQPLPRNKHYTLGSPSLSKSRENVLQCSFEQHEMGNTACSRILGGCVIKNALLLLLHGEPLAHRLHCIWGHRPMVWGLQSYGDFTYSNCRLTEIVAHKIHQCKVSLCVPCV